MQNYGKHVVCTRSEVRKGHFLPENILNGKISVLPDYFELPVQRFSATLCPKGKGTFNTIPFYEKYSAHFSASICLLVLYHR